jgi:hypothetical protein
MSEDHRTRQIEVWAVEYTTVTGERAVAVMESHEVAVGWVENLVRTSWAEPVLLQGATNFYPSDECEKLRTG